MKETEAELVSVDAAPSGEARQLAQPEVMPAALTLREEKIVTAMLEHTTISEVAEETASHCRAGPVPAAPRLAKSASVRKGEGE